MREALPHPSALRDQIPLFWILRILPLTQSLRLNSLLMLTYGRRSQGALEGSSGLGNSLGRWPRQAVSIRQFVMAMRGAVTLILKERRGNVTENKGPASNAAERSANVADNK
jgi:hypothetical protein